MQTYPLPLDGEQVENISNFDLLPAQGLWQTLALGGKTVSMCHKHILRLLTEQTPLVMRCNSYSIIHFQCVCR